MNWISGKNATTVLLALVLIVGGGNLLASWEQVHAAQAAQRREQAAQMQQGAVIERKLCLTFGRLAALKPPPGNPVSNPSRAYLQGLHATLSQIGPDLDAASMPERSGDVPAHSQAETHHYIMHFPPHPAREDDPHYVDFHHYHQAHRAAARCFIGERIGFGDCMDDQTQPCPPPADGEQPGLELHHAHVEFSLQNGVSLTALEKDYPGISDPAAVGAWVESDSNFRWLCSWHHRGSAGAHTASHSDWEASQYVQGLISRAGE